MGLGDTPLVAVVTPMHNAQPFLAECIESVLKQTYAHFEYIILDDCSTDGSLEIAVDYAKKDKRIRIERNATPAGVMPSHNIAFNLIPPAAKYCKVVSPEDLVFSDCIRRMVEVAEANPSVGIVGSYQLSGNHVKWQGFEYPQSVVPGREMCRRVYLGGGNGFGFGTPTSVLYRADLVRASKEFYPNSAAHSDASACFKYLQSSDFGFVFEVLSYGRIHPELESAKSAAVNGNASAYLRDLTQYGPLYLSKAELEQRLKEQLHEYDLFLAKSVVQRRGPEFWDYHRGRRAELGHPVNSARILKAAAIRAVVEILNPERAFRKIWRNIAKNVSVKYLQVGCAVSYAGVDQVEILSTLIYAT